MMSYETNAKSYFEIDNEKSLTSHLFENVSNLLNVPNKVLFFQSTV